MLRWMRRLGNVLGSSGVAVHGIVVCCCLLCAFLRLYYFIYCCAVRDPSCPILRRVFYILYSLVSHSTVVLITSFLAIQRCKMMTHSQNVAPRHPMSDPEIAENLM